MNDELAGLLGVNLPKAKEEAFTKGLLGAIFQAAALSGPQRSPVGTAQGLGQIGMTALGGYESAMDKTLEQAIKGLQVRDLMAKREREANLQRAIQGAYTERPVAGLGLGAEQMASPITQAEIEAFGPQAYLSAAKTAAPMERTFDREKALQALAQYGGLEGLSAYITATKPTEAKESFRLLTKEEKKANNLPLDEQFQVSSSGKISPVSGTLVKNIVGGQSGLDNEMKIRGAFKDEPVYKGYQETQTAYKQITESLKQASPAGDLAAATKFMKLLDPGSVVRESELYMAMQASGALDRFTNYATNVIQGTKLTPTQRTDFGLLADKLYAASVDAYNKKRNEYAGFAQEYGLNPNRAVGAPATFSKNIKVDY